MIHNKYNDIDCYCCDNKELFPLIADKSIDFILSDIPYELDLHGGGSHFKGRKMYEQNRNSSLDFISTGIDYDYIFGEFQRILKKINLCIFCSNKQISKIMGYWENKGYSTTLLVWDKPNPIPFGNGNFLNNLEFIIYVREPYSTYNKVSKSMQLKTFRYSSVAPKKRLHETEKPQGLLSHLLSILTNEGDVVLDPFAGSFSTAVACYNGKRKFIGCEMLPKYYDKAIKRLQQVTAQQQLF